MNEIGLDAELSAARSETDGQPLAGNGMQPAVQPYLTIRPKQGWQALDLREVWQFRDLLWTLAARDLKLRYRQTVLGVLWVVLQPLIGAAIFALVFGRVAKLPSEGVPYFFFSYAGLLGWNAFSSTLNKSSTVLLGNAGLISKVYFPRLILPLSTMFSTFIDLGVALAVLLIMMLASGFSIGAPLLLLPLWIALIVLLALGIGLYTSALMVSYRDVGHILPVATQFLMYASPVAYSLKYALSVLPPAFHVFYRLNPLAGLLEAFRWSVLGHGQFDLVGLAYSVVCVCLMFVGGALMFRRMERKFADVI